MSGDAAKERLRAIGQQLAPTPSDTFEGIPVIRKIARDSIGQRTKGKVVIITGEIARGEHGPPAINVCL